MISAGTMIQDIIEGISTVFSMIFSMIPTYAILALIGLVVFKKLT
ncbi:hypothetical protein V1503_23830 [Bacillus sp. SCS-151]